MRREKEECTNRIITMDRKNQINIWYFVLAFFGVLLLQDLYLRWQTIEPIPYSQFEEYVDNGVVDNVVIGSETIRGSFTEPQNGKTEFVTSRVESDLSDRLRETGIDRKSVV